MIGPTPVKISGVDEDGTTFSLSFESYILSVHKFPDKTVTTFSNGCVLTQKRVTTVSSSEQLEAAPASA